MLILDLEWEQAAAAAKCLRPAIEPIGGFPEVLQALEKSRGKRQETLTLTLTLTLNSNSNSNPNPRGKRQDTVLRILGAEGIDTKDGKMLIDPPADWPADACSPDL